MKSPTTSVPSETAPLDFAAQSVRGFCDALAAKTATPGGGAVAGVTAAHAAALLAMVVEYSIGKPSFATHEEEGPAILASLRSSITKCLAAANGDAAAYGVLNRLWKRPAGDPERTAGWSKAVQDAIDAPLLIVRLAAEIAGRSRDLAGHTAKHLDSDLAIAADLSGCAARAAAWNVRVNLPNVSESDRRVAIGRDLDELLAIIAEDIAITDRLLSARR